MLDENVIAKLNDDPAIHTAWTEHVFVFVLVKDSACPLCLRVVVNHLVHGSPKGMATKGKKAGVLSSTQVAIQRLKRDCSCQAQRMQKCQPGTEYTKGQARRLRVAGCIRTRAPQSTDAKLCVMLSSTGGTAFCH